MNDSRMTSVNEEDDSSSKNTSHIAEQSDKLKDPRSCNERSDSGFSECSNCSTPSASCVCSNLTLLDKNKSIIEEQTNRSSSSDDTEETESFQPKTDEKLATADESFTVSSDHDIRSEISSLEYDDANKSTCDDNQNIVMSIRVPTRRELFQDEHGDLLSDIERRKVSLENTTRKASSVKHEGSLEKLKKNNKVALLMEKFETSNCSNSHPNYKLKSHVLSKGLSAYPQCMADMKPCGMSKISRKETTNDSPFDSYFTAKSPTRSSTNPTTFRLSNRVREVTDRLSRPKQPTSMEESKSSHSKEFCRNDESNKKFERRL